MKKNIEETVKEKIEQYIKTANSEKPIVHKVGNILHSLMQNDDSPISVLWHYRIAIRQFLHAVSQPKFSNPLYEKMCGAHYEDFIELIQHIDTLLESIENSTELMALIDWEIADNAGDVQEGDYNQMIEKYSKEIAVLKLTAKKQ